MEVSGPSVTPRALYPREMTCSSQWIGGWVNLNWFGRRGQRKNPLPLPVYDLQRVLSKQFINRTAPDKENVSGCFTI